MDRHPAIAQADPCDNRALVEAVLAGAPGAFERLVRQYQGLCWHIVLRMVRHPEDARELCQEAFLRVHQYLHQYRYDSALKSWIGQVAYSVAKRHLERKRIPLAESADEDGLSLVESIGDGFDMENANAEQQESTQLHAAIDALAAAAAHAADAVSLGRSADRRDFTHHRPRRRYDQKPPVPHPQAVTRNAGTTDRSRRMNAWNKDRQNEMESPDEREWQAQEQALRDERLGVAASGSDAPDGRTIARSRACCASRRRQSLPPDFARQVAGLADARAPLARDATRFERIMLNLLGAALVVSGIAAIAVYGNQALAGVDVRIVQWGSALAACAALSWSFDWARRQFGGDRLHHA